jgi:hypothetical protein
MSRHIRRNVLLGAVALAIGSVGSSALAQQGNRAFRAQLGGFQEVPAVSTTGSGQFFARLSADGMTLAYSLSYDALEGSTTTGAHIHLAQPNVNGGVAAFLCGGGSAPPCPPVGGTVEGMISAADVVGPAAQGIAAGEFAELLRAMSAGMTYVNVHTDKHAGGEIRGQVR